MQQQFLLFFFLPECVILVNHEPSKGYKSRQRCNNQNHLCGQFRNKLVLFKTDDKPPSFSNSQVNQHLQQPTPTYLNPCQLVINNTLFLLYYPDSPLQTWPCWLSRIQSAIKRQIVPGNLSESVREGEERQTITEKSMIMVLQGMLVKSQCMQGSIKVRSLIALTHSTHQRPFSCTITGTNDYTHTVVARNIQRAQRTFIQV